MMQKLCLLLLVAFASAKIDPKVPWRKAFVDIENQEAYIEDVYLTLLPTAPSSSRIVDGTETEPHEFPWQVSLHFNPPGGWLCGGSVIGDTWVLTAAHCVSGADDVIVTFGAHDHSNPDNCEFEVTATSMTAHPDWQPLLIKNDIALIELPSAITLDGTCVDAVGLPSDTDPWVDIDDDAEPSGWGVTSDAGGQTSNVLMSKVVSAITITNCSAVYGEVFVTNDTICTTYGTCNGDSGGPLNSYPTKGVVYGVVSFGASAGCEVAPAAYARVRYFLAWIEAETGITAQTRHKM